MCNTSGRRKEQLAHFLRSLYGQHYINCNYSIGSALPSSLLQLNKRHMYLAFTLSHAL